MINIEDDQKTDIEADQVNGIDAKKTNEINTGATSIEATSISMMTSMNHHRIR